jgi:hypothetical protein
MYENNVMMYAKSYTNLSTKSHRLLVLITLSTTKHP